MSARLPAGPAAPDGTPSWLAPVLDALDPEQRAAATLPDGPAQIIAPAGSGKTTTLVARMAVLIARGVPPESICVVTFNRDAAADLGRRITSRIVPHVGEAAHIEVRTLHALARQVLIDAADGRALVADRLPLLRAARRRILAERRSAGAIPDAAELDTLVSAWRIEGRPVPPTATAAVAAYRDILAARGAIDFDDLVVEAARRLEDDPRLRQRWQGRFRHVLVDEFQDVDAAQLRLVGLLAAPEDNLVVIGDDDQTIYAWRLADVRRILRFGELYPSARRVMLATNYRCPPAVVEASARVVAHNTERFAKPIRAAARGTADPNAIVAVSAAADGWVEVLANVAAAEGGAGRSLCFLARTRTELAPVVAGLVRMRVAHRAAVPLLVDAPSVVELVDRVRTSDERGHPFTVLRRHRLARGWARGDPAADTVPDDEHAALDALLGWASAYRDIGAFLAAYESAHARITALRDPDAPVELATVHAAKGREWETVVIIGFEEGRFPNARSIADATEPQRAIEEERRLAYVALTRATRRLVLAFDPARPSPFLAEMGLGLGRRAA
jgi:DNA helicase-2/ATP-dependent DNA helicase PcrA